MTKVTKAMGQASRKILSDISKAEHLSNEVFPFIGSRDGVTNDLKYFAEKEGVSMQSLRRKYYQWLHNGKKYSAIIDGRTTRNFQVPDDKAFSILLGYWAKSRTVSQAHKDFVSHYEREYGYLPEGFSIANARRLLNNFLKARAAIASDVAPERCKACKSKRAKIKNLIRELIAMQKECKGCDAMAISE